MGEGGLTGSVRFYLTTTSALLHDGNLIDLDLRKPACKNAESTANR